jgi:hypothetical protein
MLDEDKKVIFKELKSLLLYNKIFLKIKKSVQQFSALAGHIVAYKIAKSNKPFFAKNL